MLVVKSDIEPHSFEWFEAKCGRFSSSESEKLFSKGKGANIFGAGAFTYFNIKTAEYFTGRMKSIPEVDAVMRGLTEEMYARQRYEKLRGVTVEESGFYIYNDRFCGTTDGQLPEEDGIVEIKCLNSESHAEICSFSSGEQLKKFSPKFYCQCQSNILITGAKFCDFISYDDRMKNYDLQIKIIRIYPDAAWQQEFKNRLGFATEIFEGKCEEIIKTPTRNKQLICKMAA